MEDSKHKDEKNKDLPNSDAQEIVNNNDDKANPMATITTLTGLYEDWFLDYASYVILERAVPDVRDGYKPVQRRILHSMRELDDGRFNKVANIIGNTMKYHPHGDSSIGGALVQIGQKDLLIETQGNWGNILTGDSAAAPRYIEARLSKFALEVVFNPKTTNWEVSYDGRNKEPEFLPVKFPMTLMMGVEGIAVGLASKILPHNFIELIDASIKYLKGRSFEIYPDFVTGGIADISRYNDGLRGGRVRVRARVKKRDNKSLVITEVPFGTDTGRLIESILSANDKGKIKIKKIEDNTAENVEIVIYLGTRVSPDQTIDALYAFTLCEDSIAPNCTVISGGKPEFIGMKEILKKSADQTVALLKMELEIRRAELMEKWHFSSLEKIFIRERLYREIEEAESFDEAIAIIDTALNPFKNIFKREITREDIERLTEIRIRRISKYNEFKADEFIKGLEDEIAVVDNYLANLIEYAVDYFKRIKDKYGKGRERKTELANFDNINAAAVAVDNVKLYVNKEEGFVGTSLKKDEFVTDCSDIDDVIAFRENGSFVVFKVEDKTFIGKDIVHIRILKKNDDRTVYNMVYSDGKMGKSYVKRFLVKSVTRNRHYDLTKGKEGSKVLYFTANPNGEAEIVRVKLRRRPKLKKLQFDFDFSELAIKGRASKGNIITKNIVSSITLKEDGVSTLGAIDVWYDPIVRRFNNEERGKLLGAFGPEDLVLNIMQSGSFKTTGYEVTTHFSDDLMSLHKFNSDLIWTAVYFEGDSKLYYIKRFTFETSESSAAFITENLKSKLVYITNNQNPKFEILYKAKDGPRNKKFDIIDAEEFIDVKSFRAKGKRLTTYGVKKINMLVDEQEDSNNQLSEIIEDNNSDSLKPDLLTNEEPEATIEENTVADVKVKKSASGVMNADKEEEIIIEKTVKKAKVKKTAEYTPKLKDANEQAVNDVELHKDVSKKVQKPKPKSKPTKIEEETIVTAKEDIDVAKILDTKKKVVKEQSIDSKSDDKDNISPKQPEPIKKEAVKSDAKTKKSKKIKEKPAKENIDSVSLDGEEPLQMELDF